MRDLSTDGIWTFFDAMTAADAVTTAQRIEALGYSRIWVPETTGRDPFAHIGHLAANTTEIGFATGIANIFHRHPHVMRQAANAVADVSDGRFILGIGVSHGPLVEGLRGIDWSKPLTTMRNYLEQYKAAPYMAMPPAAEPQVVLAALGPKMLELAGAEADGAHPYWTTPEHTAQARELVGPDKLLCVEQKICLTTDAAAARAAADNALAMYATLPNYRNNWKRLGYTDEEIDGRDPRFVDAINARLDEHRDAGATHLCIQPLNPDGSINLHWEALEAFAPGA